MTNGKAFLAVLVGMAAGAALGVLFSPVKESDSDKIAKRGDDLADALGDKIQTKFDTVLDLISGKAERGYSVKDNAVE